MLKAVRAYMVIKRLSHMGTVIETIPSGREIEDEEFEHEFSVILDTSASADEICEAVLGVNEVETAEAAFHVEDEPEPMRVRGCARRSPQAGCDSEAL